MQNIFRRLPMVLNRTPESGFWGLATNRFVTQLVNGPENSNGLPKRKLADINDLFKYINSGKVFYLKQLKNVSHTIEFDKLETEDVKLLLKCCGSMVPDSSREERDQFCQDLFKNLLKVNNVNADILNSYIKTCTENSVLVITKDFIFNMEQNSETYKLLLENVCQFGDIVSSFKILETMKTKGIPLDNECASNLILAHTIKGGLTATGQVLNTLKSAHISDNNSLNFAIFVGLVRRQEFGEYEKAIDMYRVQFTENQLLEIVEELGLRGLESWLSEIRDFYKHIQITRDLQLKFEKICIHLIHMNQPTSAMNIYEIFVQPHPDASYGYVLLKEMLHCNINTNTIIDLAKSLVEKETSPNILEKLTDLSLRMKYEEQAWLLLKNLPFVRPHYFWPLLVRSSQTSGESGVFEALNRIAEYNVKLDSETLENYVIPFCDFSNLKLLFVKLYSYNFSARELLSPMLMVLLRDNKTKNAATLCKLYPEVTITDERFLYHLARSWTATKDSTSICLLLRRYCESNPTSEDSVGSFLIHIGKIWRSETFIGQLLEFLKVIEKQRLKISTQSAEILKNVLKQHINENVQSKLNAALHPLIDFTLNVAEDTAIPPLKDSDLEGLECHLIELQEKHMETRGILRKLIQLHASKGNLQRVTELRKLFIDSGYEESPGMQSAIMHNYGLAGKLDEAMSLYEEIKMHHPGFKLDHFKILDLAKLLIENDRFYEAIDILEQQLESGTIRNTKAIERNCRLLLNACKDVEQLDTTFQLLLDKGACTTSNVMLGPLVRIHLDSDIGKAAEKYIECCNRYKCTPLQLEVLRAVAKSGNTGLLEKVYKATEFVHGSKPAQVGLIAAFAENDQKNALRNILNNVSNSITKLLEARFKRWVDEGKVDPLKCFVTVCTRLDNNIINAGFLINRIFDVYELKGDYNGALEYFQGLAEEFKTLELEQRVQNLQSKNKRLARTTA